jgi:DNA polymerase-3 subunit epsilon
MPKYAYIDLETTGTDPLRHGIHQIALTLECDGETVDLNYKVRPMTGKLIDDRALEVGGVTREQVNEYPTPYSIYSQIVSELSKRCEKYDRTDKFFVIAYNAGFDSDFLRQFFLDNGDQYYGSFFWHPPICVMQMAAARLVDQRPTMPNFKLMTVAKQLGFDVDESRLHEAGYDLFLTRQLFEKFTYGAAVAA